MVSEDLVSQYEYDNLIEQTDIDMARKEIRQEQVRVLMPDVFKICTTLRDISALEQMEILDNVSPFAKNIPDKIKWDMITKCKHFKNL
jgi:hypothetical protein